MNSVKPISRVTIYYGDLLPTAASSVCACRITAAEQALKRIVNGFAEPQTPHAWMLTGVYGAGKSAFAYFLASLCASAKKEIRKRAEEIHRTAKVEKGLAKRLEQTLPEKGLVRAVVTAQREPVSHAVVRALSGGINHLLIPSPS